jgi:cytochrome c oxidase cbb3-type subunit 3
MRKGRLIIISVWLLFGALFLLSCERERREVRQAPPAVRANAVSEVELYPGQPVAFIPTKNPAESSAYDVSEGKRLFDWYNCSGCHANGGGGMGPPLIDDQWIYGSDPANIFETIVEGRPNGMPSFRYKIPDNQVWQLAAYVRSMSGLLPKDVSSGRNDDMSTHKSEQRMPAQKPKSSDLPPSAVRP